jgi:hypothetical protein
VGVRPTLNPIPQPLNPTLSEARTKFISGLKLPLFDLGPHPLRPILGRMRREEPDVTISSGAGAATFRAACRLPMFLGLEAENLELLARRLKEREFHASRTTCEDQQ